MPALTTTFCLTIRHRHCRIAKALRDGALGGAVLLLSGCAGPQSGAGSVPDPLPDALSDKDLAAAPTLLIDNIQLVDVEAGQLKTNQLVLLKDDKIVAVLPASARAQYKTLPVLDGQGAYLTPALWDMHVHFEGRQLADDNALLLPVYLAYGITAVREAASNLAPAVLNWRAEVAGGQRLGPRIFTAGQKFEGINSLWDGELEIGNTTELKAGLDQLARWQVDFIKITENTLAPELYRETIQAARSRGFLVSAHVPYGLSVDEMAQAGLSSIEHASYLLRLGFADEAQVAAKVRNHQMSVQQAAAHYAPGGSGQFDQALAVKGYQRLAAQGVAVTPTLIGGQQLANLHETDHSKDAFLRYLTRDFTANYQWRIDRMAGESQIQRIQRRQKEQLIAAQLPLLQQAGVLLLAGSDSAALNTYVYPAQALHQELLLWQQAGMQPADILRAATLNGPRFMRLEQQYGSVSVGKQADLLLLSSNPLQDIGATSQINTLIYQGKVYDRAALDALLKQAATQKEQLEQARPKS